MKPPSVLRALLTLSAASGVLAIYVFVTGGGDIPVGDLLVRIRRPWTPLWICLGSLALALWSGGTTLFAARLLAAWNTRARVAPWVAAAAAVAILATGVVKGAFVAGGADCYGYVSEGVLWAKGDVVQDNSVALWSPWPHADFTYAPLGYRPATTAGAIVPTYSVGLPLLMAVFFKVFGPQGLFWVVPLLGALAIWCTYLWARTAFDPLTGAIAAVLLACSPIFLYQTVQQMSDVPVTALWMAALALVVRRRFLGAGAAAGLALLVRPNLIPVGVCVAIAVLIESWRHTRSWKSLCGAVVEFGVPFGLAFALTLAVNQTLYGNPLMSGYGGASSLFSLSFVRPNIALYAGWMWDLQTPFVLLGLAAPFVAWWTAALRRASDGSPRTAVWPGLAEAFTCIAAVVACYLVYTPFDTWPYLRFLLPAIPLLLVLATWVSLQVVARFPIEWRVPLAAMGTLAMLVGYIQLAKATPAFSLQDGEQRYVRIARFAGDHLPPRSVVITVQHSGSLRFYANVLTLRWDWLDPAWLDRAVAHLQRAGYHPYFLIESWEEDQFRDRFSPESDLGRLDWPPLADIRDGVNGRIYDPAARAQFRSGKAIDAFIVRPKGLVARSRAAGSLIRD